MTTYDEYLASIRKTHDVTAKMAISRLYELLKQEDSNLSKDDIYDRIMKDLLVMWARSTIIDNMPDELKDKERQESGKKGRNKQLVSVTSNGSVAQPRELNNDEERPKSSTEANSPTFEKMPWQQLSDEERNKLYEATAGYYEENRKEIEKEIEKKIEEDALNTKDGIINDQKLEIDKLKELLTEQKKILDETIKSVNAAAQLRQKNIPVADSLEYKALESQIYILEQENKDLKQIAQMQMKEHPADTFKPASEIQDLKQETEVEFPARELSTLFMDARIAKQTMYLKVQNGKVVAWESDTKRSGRRS